MCIRPQRDDRYLFPKMDIEREVESVKSDPEVNYQRIVSETDAVRDLFVDLDGFTLHTVNCTRGKVS